MVHIGVPATVTGKVQKLVTLWSRSDPEVVAGRSGQKRKRGSKDDDGQDENDEKDNGEDPGGKDSKNFLSPHSHHSGGNGGRGSSSRATKDRRRGTGRDSRDSAESKNKRTKQRPNTTHRTTTYEIPTTPESSPTTNQFSHHDEQAGHFNNGTVYPTTEFPISPPSSTMPRKTCHPSTEFELAKGLNNGRSYDNLDGNEMRDQEEEFASVWGPEKTAAEIMSIVDGWRRAWELDEAERKARMQSARNKEGKRKDF